uniref:Reverse transcriptase n=1 Tax=Cannabis sativa TaxID=3483 RepID=A0A803PV22_CANSA
MDRYEELRVIEASGYSKGVMPFKYLGVPIFSKRLSKLDCEILTEKMIQRVRLWSSRNLSFAGRATFVNYVLIAIHIYWSQIMILPKKILEMINAICRSFLWKGEAESIGIGKVAWSKLCTPKSAGALVFKDIISWNPAAIGKFVWALTLKKENL